uniref:putative uncharacterized protein FLJ44672 n=1 Tax=Macaca mulatta TaxID=9544 RepID=UPI0010A239CA
HGCGRRPSPSLTTTSLGSAPAQLPLRGLYRSQTSWSRAPRWPLRAPLLPSDGVSTPQTSSSQPLQAQLLLWAASSGPGLDLQSASPGPASCRPKACTGPASAFQRTLNAQLSPDFGLHRTELLLPFGSSARPRSCLPVASLGPAHSPRLTAFPGPAFAFWWPLQAPNFLRPAPPGPVAAFRPPVQAQLFVFLAAAAGRALASRQSPWGRLRPNSRSAAFVGPKRPEAGPHGGLSGPRSCPPTASPHPRLPAASLSRPSSSSRRPLQAHAGLESASPGLAPASGGPCVPNSSTSRPPPAQLLPLRGLSSCQTSSGQPLQAQLLLCATGLLRPSPAHASGRPPQAQDLTSSRPRQAQPPAAEGLHRPSLCLPAHCPRPALA